MATHVLGFVFDDLNNVILIQKTKPKWQAGKLNGVGGAVEHSDKDTNVSMCREFLEETNIHTTPEEWQHVVSIFGDKWFVEVFGLKYKFKDLRHLEGKQTDTDEIIRIVNVGNIQNDKRVLNNVPWLALMCFDKEDIDYNITN